MYDSCSYHKINSLVPPSAEEDRIIQNSLMRLENICAQAVISKTYKGGPMTRTRTRCHENTLSNLPPHLHKILWDAYIIDKYYSYDNGVTFDEIPQILCNWPYEEFNLKKLMPRLSPRLDLFSSAMLRDGSRLYPYVKNALYVEILQYGIIKEILEFVLKFSNSIFSEKVYKGLKIRKIDITGYTFPIDKIIAMMRAKNFKFEYNLDRLQIVLDAEISIDDTCDAYGRLSSYTLPMLFKCHFIKVNHISVNASLKTVVNAAKLDRVNKLISFASNCNRTISINLNNKYTNNEGRLVQVYDSNRWGSNVLSVTLVGCVSSMSFLQRLKNLVHLNLTFNNMHGKLSSLTYMSRGLLYLNLSFCKLTNVDLHDLKGSCHALTLRELNLSFNNFSYDENIHNLIELCQNLQKILKLNLDNCNLGFYWDDKLSLLFNSLKTVPKLVDLNLCRNGFSIEDINVDIMKLKESNSLRYLALTVPVQVTGIEAEWFCEDIYDSFRNTSSVYVTFM